MRTILSVLVLVVLATGVYAALPGDIIFYMPFDDGAGGAVKDLSGHGNNGSIQGNTDWRNGKYGGALYLDGATNVTVPNAAPLASLSNPMSVGVWVNPEILGGWRNIVEMDGAAGWKLGFADPNTLVWTTYHVKDFIGQAPVDEGQWSHAAVTWDGAQAILYINGEPDSGGPIAGGGVINVSGEPSLDIGYRSTSASSYFQGLIDDLWISNAVKSQAEIQDLMNGLGTETAVEPGGKLTTTWGKLKVN